MLQEPEPEEEEEEEYDQELKEEFVVSQSDAGGSDRKVELKVIPTGLMLSDGGDSVVYNFSNLRAWSAEWGKTLTVKVSAGAGLVTDYSFVTPESVQILAVLERNACEVARQAINASLPGAAESKLVSGAGGIAEAELAAKLQALMEEKRTQESAPTEGGPAVNTETLGALKTTQSELAKTKARLDAARSALDAKDKEVKKTLLRLGPFVFLQSTPVLRHLFVTGRLLILGL